MAKRMLVAGAGGYVGSAVVRVLLDAGHHVTALVRPGEAAVAGIRALAGTLEDPDPWVARCAEFDAVGFFAASPSPAFESVMKRSIGAMVSVLGPEQRFSMQGGTLVFGHTDAVGGSRSVVRQPAPPLAARSAFEELLLHEGQLGDRPACSIVYASLVHGGRGAAIPGAMLRSARQRGRAAYREDVVVHWSSVHVDDWACLIASTLEGGPAEGGPYFAAGPSVTISELAVAIGGLAGVPAAPVSEADMDAAYGPFGPALCMSQRFSPHRAAELHGWRATRNDLAASLRELPAI